MHGGPAADRPRPGAVTRGPQRRPVPPPWQRVPGGNFDDPTELMAPLDRPTDVIAPVDGRDGGAKAQPGPPKGQSLARSSSMMAVANLASRVTGFLRQIALAAVLSFGLVNSSYTIANTLPNIVYEFLIGGVLTSVMIPLLVRAQKEDADGGEAYTRRLVTMAGAALLVATLVAMLAAGPLVALYMGSQTTDTANPELATAFAVLLLPEIFFYGIGALLGAILNSKGRFAAFAWAPVLNNLVMFAVLVVYVLVPGEISLDPVRMGDTKLLVLGIGTTLGIAVQALVLLPAIRRAGVSLKPLWGWDPRLSSAGGLALWVVAYVLVGQAGLIVTTRVATASDPGAYAIYSNAWLLLQVPYGVLGVSLLTALMPRMSRAAAENRFDAVVSDLSLGSRLSTVFLVPISVLLTFFGTEVGLALFSLGAGNAGGGAAKLGTALAWSAFGLLPYAITLLQLRVFYAMTDSRTPTLIMVGIVAVKIPMLLLCPVLLSPEDVVLGLVAANSLSFVFGAILGQWVIARRLGHVRSREVLSTLWRTLAASVAAGLVAWLAGRAIQAAVGSGSAGTAWLVLAVALAVATPILLVGMKLLKLTELDPLWRRLPARLRR
ncbi:murein biosynthesis integral membrane protein MurJ [Pseudonocardia sp. NPDC049154]|uniref:murein biosynthesis integral membrane protein MurJ n=1 Tax=Pseudonocardia sp. NPDC049154 TaxID=3155501 RepID=UPI00340F52DB